MSTPIEAHLPAPDGVTARYAAASGDQNPIHLDEEFARSVGLPGRILHGLWTAAQVARVAQSAAPSGAVLDAAGSEARYGLAFLKLQFRGMGVMGPEIVVSGSADDAEDGIVAVKLDAVQDGTRLVRGAEARLRVS